eukprot:COSAG04_NODE_5005_length_1784_cov_1.227300_3_plen_94_part_00
MHLVAATPRLLDAFLDCLKAYEAAPSAEDANVMAVYGALAGLYGVGPALFEFSELNRAAVRDAASSIRFALDHPLTLVKEFSVTTNMIAVRTK